MDCLELGMPPLPQLVTVNQSLYTTPSTHFERTFPLYDILIVTRGEFYMTEEGTPYTIRENCILTLEPNKRHWGHRACTPDTEVYYFHFKHTPALRMLSSEEVLWNSIYPSPNYSDQEPRPQFMYIPKFGEIDTNELIPLLLQMTKMRRQFTLEDMLPLQTTFSQVLLLMQKAIRSRSFTRSQEVSELIIRYLNENINQSLHLGILSQTLNYHIDYLSKCLKKHSGLTPIQYLNRLRIEKARLFLVNSDFSLHQVCEKVGITDYNYFFRLFRKHAGLTPSQYRQKYKL